MLPASVTELARRGVEALQRGVLGHGQTFGGDQRRQERPERAEPHRMGTLAEAEAPHTLAG